MKKFIELIILIIIGYNFNIYAQSTANYAFTYSNTGSLTDMSSGTTDLLATGTYYDDVASSVTNLGFSFYFMGTAYTQFSINSNGLMKLGGTAINGSAITPEANMPYFAPIGGNNAIMSSGKVHYKLTGTTPNQVLIIEWRDLRIPNLNGTGTYCLVQARIYEGSSKIEYVYGTMYNNSTGITRPIFISSSNTAAGTIGSVTIGSTPTFTTNSATPIANSLPNNNYITNLHSTADGSRWLYTFIRADVYFYTGIYITGSTNNNDSDEYYK